MIYKLQAIFIRSRIFLLRDWSILLFLRLRHSRKTERRYRPRREKPNAGTEGTTERRYRPRREKTNAGTEGRSPSPQVPADTRRENEKTGRRENEKTARQENEKTARQENETRQDPTRQEENGPKLLVLCRVPFVGFYRV